MVIFRELVLLTIGGAWVSVALASTLPIEDPAPAIEEIKTTASVLAQGRACKWLMPYDEVAIQGKMNVLVERIRILAGTKAGLAALAASLQMPATEPCESPADEQRRNQTFLIRIEMLSRTAALEIYGGKGLIEFGSEEDARIANSKRLKETFFSGDRAAPYDRFWTQTSQDAYTFIALICPERAKRSANPARKCPALAEDKKRYMPLAVAELKAVEAFVAAFDAGIKAERVKAEEAKAEQPQGQLQLQLQWLPPPQPSKPTPGG